MPKIKMNDRPEYCIADNIKLLLYIRGIKRKDFCKRMVMSESQLSVWFHHKAIPPTMAIFRAAEILKVTPAQLITPAREFDNEVCQRMIV